MSTIDDPVEATLSQYPKAEQTLPKKLADTTLDLFGLVDYRIKVLNIIRSRILGDQGKERVEALLDALRKEVKQVREQSEKNYQDQQAEIGSLREKLDSPEFIEAMVVAADEVQRSMSESKVTRFATLLSNGLFSKNEDVVAGDDLAAHIRDLASLGESDIHALYFLFDVYKDTIRARPDMTDPNDFTLLMGSFTRGIKELKIDPDDFFGRCLRLSGFGLATEVQRNEFRMSLQDHCFRPTKRGLRLLKLLGKAI
jgi:hypothetical protein